MTNRSWFFRSGLVLFVAAAALTLKTTAASAQNVDKFVISNEAAKRALNKTEISAETARRLAQACEDYARQNNFTASMAIVSSSGTIVHAHRMDGQLPNAMEVTLKKTETALYMRRPTHELGTQFDMEGRLLRAVAEDWYYAEGGFPIIVDDQIIGAMGVGGAGRNNSQCAHHALTQVIGPQPPLTQAQPGGGGAATQQGRPPQR